jgi:hypothetical protein
MLFFDLYQHSHFSLASVKIAIWAKINVKENKKPTLIVTQGWEKLL